MAGKTAAMKVQMAEPATGPRWFVVECRHQREREAKKNLVAQGFDAYLPMRLCPRKDSRHPATPFFPHYLFIRFDPNITQWMKICSTEGVHALIVNGQGKPQAVADGLIERVKGLEIDGVIHVLGTAKRSEPVFKAGDKVTVTAGPFAGIEGLVRIVHDNDRATVMLGLVARGESALKIQLPSGSLRGAALR